MTSGRAVAVGRSEPIARMISATGSGRSRRAASIRRHWPSSVAPPKCAASCAHQGAAEYRTPFAAGLIPRGASGVPARRQTPQLSHQPSTLRRTSLRATCKSSLWQISDRHALVGITRRILSRIILRHPTRATSYMPSGTFDAEARSPLRSGSLSWHLETVSVATSLRLARSRSTEFPICWRKRHGKNRSSRKRHGRWSRSQ